jgi:hypothetical protein
MGFFHSIGHAFKKATHAVGHVAKKVVHSKAVRSVAKVTKKAAVKVYRSKPVRAVTHNKATRWIAGKTKADDLLKKVASKAATVVVHGVSHPIETLKHLHVGKLRHLFSHQDTPKPYEPKLPSPQPNALAAEDTELLMAAGGVGMLALMLIARR